MADHATDAATGTVFGAEVAEWLMESALDEAPLEEVFAGASRRIKALGLPLIRAQLAFRTLHPMVQAVGITWTASGGLKREEYPHMPAEEQEATMRGSPFSELLTYGITGIRRRLSGPLAQLDYPLLEEFRDAGGTDYYAYLVPFAPGRDRGVIGSWLVDRPAGFTEAEIGELKLVQKSIAVVCKMRVEAEIARNVATTYLGPRSGQRVLSGRIKRGDAEPVSGAIWYSDLRRSTELSRANTPERFLEMLNAYFEVTAGSVMDSGGEVLLLIGDAVLAIFQDEQRAETSASCANAMQAARAAAERLKAANLALGGSDGNPIEIGVGLHVGEFLLGNIGVPSRLEFTAIGPVINEVARLEALTKETGHRVVASRQFADRQPDRWTPLGRHHLRGFGDAVDVFGLEV